MNEKSKTIIYMIIIVAVISSVSTYGISSLFSIQSFEVEAEKTDAQLIQVLAGFTNQQQLIRTEKVSQTIANPESMLKQVEFDSGFQLVRGNILNDTNNIVQTGDILELGVIQAQPICQYVIQLDDEQISLIDFIEQNESKPLSFTLEKNPNCQPDTFAYELFAWKELDANQDNFDINEFGLDE